MSRQGDNDWHILRVEDEGTFEQVRGWIGEALTQWYDRLKDPQCPQPVEIMVQHVATSLPDLWILTSGDRWLGMGCLLLEADGSLSPHGVMRRDPTTGEPLLHVGRRAVMREMARVKNNKNSIESI